MAQDDEHALHLARTTVSTLHTRKQMPADVETPEDPLYDPRELYGLVNIDLRMGALGTKHEAPST